MQKRSKTKTISDLTEDLSALYDEARNGTIPVKQAKDIAIVASKLIRSATAKLEYNRHMEIRDEIDFLKK
jgi:hypothetical protein